MYINICLFVARLLASRIKVIIEYVLTSIIMLKCNHIYAAAVLYIFTSISDCDPVSGFVNGTGFVDGVVIMISRRLMSSTMMFYHIY